MRKSDESPAEAKAAKPKEAAAASADGEDSPISRPYCGIVMPISAIDDCSESHWGEVLSIIQDAIDAAGFDSNLVSYADEAGVIHGRIVRNLYQAPMVVCDVSGRNPNVMFELGLRLAFDKPTVIIKDDRTSFSFDTGPMEHLEYPRSLRFGQIVEFKKNLAAKITATHKAATNDPDYSTFLKHFGEFKVAKIETKEVPAYEAILEEIRSLGRAISLGDRAGARALQSGTAADGSLTARHMYVCGTRYNAADVYELAGRLNRIRGIAQTETIPIGPDHYHLHLITNPIPSTDVPKLCIDLQNIIFDFPVGTAAHGRCVITREELPLY